MKTLKKFEFKAATTQSKYPWEAFLDGKINQLVRGEDYDAETDAMIGKIKKAARRLYKTVKISKCDAEGNPLTDSLIVQATPMNDEQRAAEDLKREQKKADKTEEAAAA